MVASSGFCLACRDLGIPVGSWVSVELNGTRAPSTLFPTGGLEHYIHHPIYPLKHPAFNPYKSPIQPSKYFLPLSPNTCSLEVLESLERLWRRRFSLLFVYPIGTC